MHVLVQQMVENYHGAPCPEIRFGDDFSIRVPPHLFLLNLFLLHISLSGATRSLVRCSLPRARRLHRHRKRPPARGSPSGFPDPALCVPLSHCHTPTHCSMGNLMDSCNGSEDKSDDEKGEGSNIEFGRYTPASGATRGATPIEGKRVA